MADAAPLYVPGAVPAAATSRRLRRARLWRVLDPSDRSLVNDGPLSANGPGDISKWMAVPWQDLDTASCRAGYPQVQSFRQETPIPTFWPSRVPNTVLSEDNYKIVMDKNQPMEKRIRAFYENAAFGCKASVYKSRRWNNSLIWFIILASWASFKSAKLRLVRIFPR